MSGGLRSGRRAARADTARDVVARGREGPVTLTVPASWRAGSVSLEDALDAAHEVAAALDWPGAWWGRAFHAFAAWDDDPGPGVPRLRRQDLATRLRDDADDAPPF